MPGHPGSLEQRLEQLARRLADVERRLVELEDGPGAPEAPVAAAAADPAAAEVPLEGAVRRGPGTGLQAGAWPALIGRTLMVLAGAFLLRAITEAGLLPRGAGTALGIGYAMLWIVLADRAVARDRRTSATFHGLAAAAISFPLLWEATVRFGFLSATASAAALTLITALALVVALRRSLRRLAWVFTIGAASTALALAVPTKMLVLFAAFLLLLGLATLWLGYRAGWRGPGWLAAVTVDLTVLLLTVMALVGKGERLTEILNPASLVALQLGLVVVYFGSFALRTLTQGEDLTDGEIIQGLAVLLIGLGGAIAVRGAAGLVGTPIGVVCLVLAVACYAAAFVFIDRRLGTRTNFIAYTSLALLFALVALCELIEGWPLAVALAVLALSTAWLGGRRQRATLSLHGAAYALAAAITSGLAAGAVDALVGPGRPTGGWIDASVLIALVVTAACCWMPTAMHGRTWGRFSRAPKLVLLTLLTLSVCGIAVSLTAPLLVGGSKATFDAGALASLRTGVVALIVLGLARLGRWPRCAEAALLVYPVLIVGGLKLVLEDMRAGRPSTLFVSLALYGGALIIAPRLMRRRPDTSESDGP